jgi:cytochrome-b5 reductase
VLDHALNGPANRTRFTLLYANVTEADILLREELAALERARPNTFRVVHTLNNPPCGGLVRRVGIRQQGAHQGALPPGERGDKVKVFLCGAVHFLSVPCAGRE